MPSSIICGRTRNTKSKTENITFHRFSSDEIIRNKWFDFLAENNLSSNNITKYSLICSSHFNSKLFINYKNTRLLEKTSVPTIIISRVKYAKDKFPEYATPVTKSIESNFITNQPIPQIKDNSQIDGIKPFDTCEPSASSSKKDLVPFDSFEPSTSRTSTAYFSIMRPSTNKILSEERDLMVF